MQATQSSTASGKTGRQEQFAALRYISRQLEISADAGQDEDRGRGRPPGTGGGGLDGFDIAQDAASLLAVLSLYSELLARPDLSWDEHLEYAAQLKVLTDRSWELVGRFLRRSRGEMRWMGERAGLPAAVVSADVAGADVDGAGLPARRGPTSERGTRVMEGAAGWMAC